VTRCNIPEDAILHSSNSNKALGCPEILKEKYVQYFQWNKITKMAILPMMVTGGLEHEYRIQRMPEVL
jgi:hypothetical protein